MSQLTQEQKEEIFYGVDNEGMDYYFMHYGGKWEQETSEISELVKQFRSAGKALKAVIDTWEIED